MLEASVMFPFLEGIRTLVMSLESLRPLMTTKVVLAPLMVDIAHSWAPGEEPRGGPLAQAMHTLGP